jgi:hypothetical protein
MTVRLYRVDSDVKALVTCGRAVMTCREPSSDDLRVVRRYCPETHLLTVVAGGGRNVITIISFRRGEFEGAVPLSES